MMTKLNRMTVNGYGPWHVYIVVNLSPKVYDPAAELPPFGSQLQSWLIIVGEP